MPIHTIFRVRNHALLMALSAAYPSMSYAVGSAQIDFAAGPVTAVSATGTQRPLTKGAEVSNGDTIRTGDGGRAQVKFSDGAMISLQPATEFRIDNYQFSNKADGQEKGFFSLLKGGMRTITGLIGRSNRDNYKVTTSVATIGIRGTEYTAGLNSSGDNLLVHTGEGLIEVCNSAGCTLLGAGESGAVTGPNVKPKRTESRPQLPPAQPQVSVLPVYSSADTVNDLYIPTSPMPTTGTASYSTVLTQSAGASQLTSASVSVNFGSLAVSTSLNGLVSSQSFSVSGSGSIGGNTYSHSLSGSGGGFCGCSCSGSVSGAFYGAAADRVGISYSITNGSSTGSGSATIQR
jgi:hypothetical protein